MEYKRSFMFALMLVFFTSLAFSTSLYTNNQAPEIKIQLLNPLVKIEITNATLFYDGNSTTIEIGEVYDPATETEIFEIMLNTQTDFGIQNISQYNNIEFKLNVVDFVERTPIKTQGTPTSLEIVFDNENPQLLRPSEVALISKDQQILNLEFSEQLKQYSVSYDDITQNFLPVNNYFKPYSSTIPFDLSQINLEDGELKTITLDFTDLAGNSNTAKFTLALLGDTMSIKLLTKEEDETLQYFYKPELKQFLGNKIYYRDEDNTFKVKLQTLRNAKCYYTDALIKFDSLPDPNVIREIPTTDNRIHEFDYNLVPAWGLWVACDDLIQGDRIFLSEELGLGQSLLKFEKFTGGNLNIENLQPISGSILTALNTEVSFTTTNPTQCEMKINGAVYNTLTNTGETNYLAVIDNLADKKNYKIDIECFDRFYQKTSKSISFSTDVSKGLHIVSTNPDKYLSSSSASIEVTISEGAGCFKSNSTTPLTGTSTVKTLPALNLKEGENKVEFYCLRGGDTKYDLSKTFIYDPNPPTISNLKYFAGGEPVDYLGNYQKLPFGFNYSSLIPLDKVFVTIEKGTNDTFKETISSNKATLSVDLENASTLKVIAQDKLGRNSSEITKPIAFDFEPPTISVNINEGTITCSDTKTWCNSIRYGTSTSRVLCVPTNSYTQNSTIDLTGKNYVCVRATDIFGNAANLTQIIAPVTTQDNQTSLPKPIDKDDEDDEVPTPTNETNTTKEPEELKNPFDKEIVDTEQEDGFNYVLVLAILIVFAGISGTGFYAYKKGYLNNQLEKLGLKKKSSSSSSQSGSSSSSGFNSDKERFISQQNKKQAKKTTYEDHLSRINDFIDGKLEKHKGMFDNFSKEELKTSGKEDEVDDEFYKNSKSDSPSEHHKKSEDFEDYHKSKNKSE